METGQWRPLTYLQVAKFLYCRMWKFQEGEFEEKLEVGLGEGLARAFGVESDPFFAVRIGARIAP
jgi:hypothetical protein